MRERHIAIDLDGIPERGGPIAKSLMMMVFLRSAKRWLPFDK